METAEKIAPPNSTVVQAEHRFKKKTERKGRTGRKALTLDLIKATVAKALRGEVKSVVYLTDLVQPGFGAYVTKAGVASWWVEPPGKNRGTFGRVNDPAWPDVGAARAHAVQLLAAAGRGEDYSKAALAAAAALPPYDLITLKDAFEAFIAERRTKRKKPLRKKTEAVYRSAFMNLASWHHLPLFTITGEMVRERIHKVIAEVKARMAKKKTSDPNKKDRGDAVARLTFAILSGVWTYSRIQARRRGAQVPHDNPCNILLEDNLWPATVRRKRKIERNMVVTWWKLLDEITRKLNKFGEPVWEPMWALFFRVLYLTGCRMSEVLHAEWAHINFELGVWTFPAEVVAVGTYEGTKAARELQVYMGPELAKMLKAFRTAQGGGRKYIFSTAADRTMPHGANDAIKKFREVFPDFQLWSNHDLRRMFTSAINSKDLTLPPKLVKMLVNHEHEGKTDVTDGYVEFEHEDRVYWGKKIEAQLLKRAGVKR